MAKKRATKYKRDTVTPRIKQKRPTRGQPTFIPTRVDRHQVAHMSGLGVPQREIATLIVNPCTGSPISYETLKKRFRSELTQGAAIANKRIAGALYRKAMGDGPGAVTGCIFWLKARANWSEHEAVALTPPQILMVPPSMSLDEWSKQQALQNQNKPKPSSDKDPSMDHETENVTIEEIFERFEDGEDPDEWEYEDEDGEEWDDDDEWEYDEE